jgi:ABC-2 type transport system ATP-binding protein
LSQSEKEAMSPQIVVEGISKNFGGTRVVDDLSFVVGPGQILGLVGQNGAGKTTTLQMLAGITRPTLGSVRIAGIDMRQSPIEAKKAIGYVPDNPRLFSGLTVWEHLAFTAATYGVTDFRSKAERLLSQFELEPKRDELAQNLSLGMRQKVSVICAYLHDPRVLLFDEPLTGLDPKGIRVLTDSMLERAALGTSLIVSSHLLKVVEVLCTDLLLLNRGRRVAFGPIDTVVENVSGSHASKGLEEVFFAITQDDS